MYMVAGDGHHRNGRHQLIVTRVWRSGRHRLIAKDANQACWHQAAEQGRLYWRPVAEGDRWQALGSSGHKSLLRWLRERACPTANVASRCC